MRSPRAMPRKCRKPRGPPLRSAMDREPKPAPFPIGALLEYRGPTIDAGTRHGLAVDRLARGEVVYVCRVSNGSRGTYARVAIDEDPESSRFAVDRTRDGDCALARDGKSIRGTLVTYENQQHFEQVGMVDAATLERLVPPIPLGPWPAPPAPPFEVGERLRYVGDLVELRCRGIVMIDRVAPGRSDHRGVVPGTSHYIFAGRSGFADQSIYYAQRDQWEVVTVDNLQPLRP